MKNLQKNYFFLVIFLISCSTDSEKIVLHELSEIDLKNRYNLFAYISPVKSKENNIVSSKLHFIDLIQRKNVIVDLNSKNIEEIHLSGKGLRELYYYSLTGDTIYNFNDHYRTIILKDKYFGILDSFSIPEKYSPHVLVDFPLKISKDALLMANASETISFQKTSDRRQYYSKVKPVLKIQLLDTSVNYYALGKFPENYQLTGDDYRDSEPKVCFGDNNTICLSFKAGHMLYKYDDTTLILEKEVRSDYIDKFIPYPDEKVFDMLFLKKYIVEEPGYTSIIYDPWRKYYYRLVKHRSKFDQKTGKTNSNKWPVIITDKEFNKIDEIVFDNSYNSHVFIPVEEGIIMHKNKSLKEENSVLKLFSID